MICPPKGRLCRSMQGLTHKHRRTRPMGVRLTHK